MQRLVCDMASVMTRREDEIERLQQIIKQLQRAQFGRRSERLDPDQMALALEDLNGDLGFAETADDLSGPPVPEDNGGSETCRGTSSRALPDHLPRRDIVLDAGHAACPDCGGVLHAAGESVSEMLDWVPAELRVLRIRRPKYGCRDCGRIHQAHAPERPIARGLATPALLSHVLISKYCDHTPLYRQTRIFARHGIDLKRSTLANWVGGACWWFEALHDRLRQHILTSDQLFADDTPLPVLDPGRGRTRTGRLWVMSTCHKWTLTQPVKFATDFINHFVKKPMTFGYWSFAAQIGGH